MNQKSLRKFASTFVSLPSNLHTLPLGLIVGLGFRAHGYAKLARGTDAFLAILHAIGTPLPKLLAWATVVVEIVGGFLILDRCVPLRHQRHFV
ncbi:MAG: DoxX family protein [Rhodanobacter sp.]